MGKRRQGQEDQEIANAVAIADSLRAAALMLTVLSADLGDFEAFMEQGMLKHAWEELRDAAGEHGVPFAFWTEMSKAADLMGAPF
ncbi:MAG TPA: hypothetical protein VFE58_19650 [Tepidisphaeraceae bacterium]|jgi:hypothetical protein|nr:hypothetical protein [Tepidisphaeraceae bacterium]